MDMEKSQSFSLVGKTASTQNNAFKEDIAAEAPQGDIDEDIRYCGKIIQENIILTFWLLKCQSAPPNKQ